MDRRCVWPGTGNRQQTNGRYYKVGKSHPYLRRSFWNNPTNHFWNNGSHTEQAREYFAQWLVKLENY